MYRIKDWPENERPREKLLQRGSQVLTDAELLALVLRTGDAASKRSALDHARLLLDRFGSLPQLAAASLADLQAVKGIGPAKAAELQAVFEIARRFGQKPLRTGCRYRHPQEVYDHFFGRLADHRRELFLVLLLDSKNRLLREVQISEGSLTASIVHPRGLRRSGTGIGRRSAAGAQPPLRRPDPEPRRSRDHCPP
ncbi:MAG: UPF0758 domain-containing protein [Syntrophotaleaceae bacterium]